MTERHIEEIRRGSIKAFEVLFNEYYHKVKSFAFGMLKNELEAEEVAQVVFTKVWISRDRIVSSKSLSAYIFTITRNEVVDFFRADFYYKNFLIILIHQFRYHIVQRIFVKQKIP